MPFNNPIPDRKPRSKASSGIESLVQAEKLMQIALLLPSAAFIGWLIGSWLDRRLHQSWIGLVGIVFGGIAGLVHVIRLVMVAGRNPDAKGLIENGDGKGSTDERS
jgi:ATP synthase protein I